jgi:hypothetical protein
MNEKDKEEAFDKWFSKMDNAENLLHFEYYLHIAWQTACEYKQKEIDELIKDNKFQADVMCDMGEIVLENKKLEAENKKLREALEKLSLYVSYNGDTWVQETAREALKEVENK